MIEKMFSECFNIGAWRPKVKALSKSSCGDIVSLCRKYFVMVDCGAMNGVPLRQISLLPELKLFELIYLGADTFSKKINDKVVVPPKYLSSFRSGNLSNDFVPLSVLLIYRV